MSQSATRATTTACHTSRHGLTHAGSGREYWLHRPCCRAAPSGVEAEQDRPLVIMLHGWGELAGQYAGELVNARYVWRAGADRWAEEAEASCFYVAWPQGLITRLGSADAGSYFSHSSWNAGGCSSAGPELCDAAAYGTTCSRESCGGVCAPCAWCSCADDVGFITQLVRSLLASDLGIDSRRVFLAGCSNGGLMTWEMALHGPSLFAAFATNCGVPHAGQMCSPPRPLPLVHIHAVNDETIPFDGAPATDGGYRYTSADEALTAVSNSGGDACDVASLDEAPWHSLYTLHMSPVPGANDEQGSRPTALAWLRGINLAGRNASHDLDDGRCRLRANCTGGLEMVCPTRACLTRALHSAAA